MKPFKNPNYFYTSLLLTLIGLCHLISLTYADDDDPPTTTPPPPPIGDDSPCNDFTDSCPENFTEVYSHRNDDTCQDKTTIYKFCCPDGDYNEKTGRNLAMRCQVSECIPSWHPIYNSTNVCPGQVEYRWINGEPIEFQEYSRDHCQYNKKHLGIEALCCPPNSQELMLTLAMGAERHQFPHFVKVGIANDQGTTSECGGTIYNENYVITASHCVMKKGRMRPSEGSNVELNVYLSSDQSPQTIKILNFTVHPNSTLRLKGDKITPFSDVALLLLEKPINFTLNPNVKALPIAKEGFNPFLYADQAVIVGLGLTDTTETAAHLQRANVILRRDKENIVGGYWDGTYTMDQALGVIFAGGTADGKASPISGEGDSGGPLICRNENGFAVLCGTDCQGPTTGACVDAIAKNLSLTEIENICAPEAYMETANYSSWIESIAGPQREEQLGWFPLYGTEVKSGNYFHQVHITSVDGSSCGGTLIRQNVVLTAAHCVADENQNQKDGLKVTAMFQDLNLESNGKSFGVTNVKVHEKFRKSKSSGARRRRIAMLNVKPTPPQAPYYRNNLALVKLDVTGIEPNTLPQIGEATISSSYNPIWTQEVSFPLNKKRSGMLQQRDFRLLSNETCQSRWDRATFSGYVVKVDENVICGEEKYNGGTQCDRELGGGLFCGKDDNGRDILCGIQTFRFCDLALPVGFLNVNNYRKWINDYADAL